MATITGIYKITNTINGKCYVGQSVNVTKRWQYYQYGSKDHTPILFAIDKYGKENFVFEVIEECDRELLNDREIFWIKELSALSPNGYNLSAGGRKTTWLYKPSKETLQKRSVALTGKKRSAETRLKMSIAQKGRKVSLEHRQKLSEANKGQPAWNKGVPMTDEVKKKVAESKRGKSAYWRAVKIARSDGTIFESITSAAKDIGVHRITIQKHLQGRLKTVRGFTFERQVA
jgi:group I intron endonuclease